MKRGTLLQIAFVLLLSIAPLVAKTGCDSDSAPAREGPGGTDQTATHLLLPIPYSINRVSGAALISVDPLLEVEITLTGGSKDRLQFHLTQEQTRSLKPGSQLLLEDAEGWRKHFLVQEMPIAHATRSLSKR